MSHGQSLIRAALFFLSIAVPIALLHALARLDASEQLGKDPVNDAIVSCLQREGTPTYGVGPAGVPAKHQPLTGDHVVVVCMEEKR